MKLLLLVAVALVQTALAYYRSPFLGSLASLRYRYFDDGVYAIRPPVTRIDSILIHHGELVNGIQAVYTLSNGENTTSGFHGRREGNASLLQLTAGEYIVRVEGVWNTAFISTVAFSRITLYTWNSVNKTIKVYGPYGTGAGAGQFNFAGLVLGLFGRSEGYLRGVGFDIDANISASKQPYYKKSALTGGYGGEAFDDRELVRSTFRIKTLTIRHSDKIDGIETSYLLPDESVLVIGHGALRKKIIDLAQEKKYISDAESKNTTANDTQIDLDDDERIIQASVGMGSSTFGPILVQYLLISTINSEGSRKVYGPFGTTPAKPSVDIVTIQGVINGFFGREGDWINSLGFYV